MTLLFIASGGAKSGSNDSLLDTIKVEKQKSNLLDIPSSSPSVDESPIMMVKNFNVFFNSIVN